MDTVRFPALKPGLLVKEDPDEYDIFLVVKDKSSILLKDICTGDEIYPGPVSYTVVGKKRSEDILVSVMCWGCREDFPMEELKDLLKERSDKRQKTYVCFPNDGSDTYMGIFTSVPVTEDEAYYLYLKSHDRLFGM